MRLFTAIELPEPVREYLLRIRTALAKSVDLADAVSWVKPENLHVTLKFLGEVPDETAGELATSLGRIQVASMRLAVDHIVYFPKRGAVRVIAGGFTGDVAELVDLFSRVEDVCAAAGFEREGRAYTPHVTLGRARYGRGGAALRRVREKTLAHLFPGPEFSAAGFVLMRSQLHPEGAIYTPVARFSAEAGT